MDMSSLRTVEKYCVVASSGKFYFFTEVKLLNRKATALLWYDFLLTLKSEVRCIWQQNFGRGTVIYFCVRYILFVERVVIILEVLWSKSDTACTYLTHVDDILYAVNYFAVAAFTALRGYAICSQDWRPMIVIVPLLLINPVIVLVSDSVLHH